MLQVTLRTIYLFGLIFILFYGCSPTIHQTYQTTPARIGPETPFHSDLTNLPTPQEKVITAVYKFRDQTGQYKPTEMGSSWSTAVTQGATTILIRTLEESGWFMPIERENIGNLLNERKIIRSSRAQYEGDNAAALPPLLFAGIIIEGGIISYESNVRTGGVGIRYFGTGGSGQYREDRVSIYLRAVSTSNGKILKTVYSTKSILSQKMDFGVFRYVKFKRLLEAETGVTYNEPSEMAVTEAIEKATYSLILEGLIANLWNTNATDEEKEQAIRQYLSEKEENLKMDHLGRKITNDHGMISLGAMGAINHLDSDIPNTGPGYSGGIQLNIQLSPVVTFSTEASYGVMAPQKTSNSEYYSITPALKFHFLPREKLSPYLGIGYGFLSNNIEKDDPKYRNQFGYLSTSLGIKYNLSSRFLLNFDLHNKYFNYDDLDRINQGHYRDMIWEARIGVHYIFGKNWLQKCLLKK